MTPDRLPPQDRGAERATLGSMIRNNFAIDEIARMLRAESFYFDAHQKIAAAIFDLHNQGIAVDLVTLRTELDRRKQLADVGESKYLVEIFEAAGTGANAIHYAGIVRDKWLGRELIHLTTSLCRDAYDQALPADQLMDKAERELLQLTADRTTNDPVTLQEALTEAFAEIDRRAKSPGEMHGLTTGFIDLDAALGGLHKGEVTIIAGRPGDGKTTLAANFMSRLCEYSDARVLFISLEMSRIEIAERMCCAKACVDHFKIRKNALSESDQAKLLEANDVIHRYKLFIDDSPAATIGKIASTARHQKHKHGLDAVFIDYLQLISPEDRRVGRVEQVDEISRRLKQLARELKVPVVALCQLNRESESTDGPPKLRHLRESGGIEQNADNVLALHRPGKSTGEDNLIEIHILKQRNGPTDKIDLCWQKRFLRFENYAVGSSFDAA